MCVELCDVFRYVGYSLQWVGFIGLLLIDLQNCKKKKKKYTVRVLKKFLKNMHTHFTKSDNFLFPSTCSVTFTVCACVGFVNDKYNLMARNEGI